MASDPSRSSSSQPSHASEERAEDQAPKLLQQYNDLISTLPLEEGWQPVSLRKYKGVWLPGHEIFLRGIFAIQSHFKSRPTDILLATLPKSGTTWLKALIFATMTRSQYSFADHPLLSLNPHNCVHSLEELWAIGQPSKIEALPSPRLLNTHMPYSVLPDAIRASDCRIIYVCRDPKDRVVSAWQFTSSWHRSKKATGEMMPTTEALSLATAVEMVCQGNSPFGPDWDHVLEYWRESLRQPENVLFLKYEEVMEESVANAKRLAEFMGCPFSLEEEKEGVVEKIITLCSFDKLSKLEVNQNGDQASVFRVPNSCYFRKGKVGDWRNHLSPEMARRLDGIMDEKLRGSGPTLGGVRLQAPNTTTI
ncbi:cytosolic sulfotransferase 12 [Elaeis guineensis]|uniref:Sulfotransferase n=1 Tax=Elaeis guineensis var. tenera TaxID=51953 RepID=A0A6I9S960_ELAGV|nr:cytosolic sulfotransferase 12 [Elaeis guineensis]